MPPHARNGYAMLTVLIFALVIVIAGMAMFAMATYETRGALYRQHSSEAFYLADGAVERARAKYLKNINFDTTWTAVPCGQGTYDLSMRDTTYLGQSAVRLRATGHVKNANRSVEVVAKVPPAAYDLAMLIMGDAGVGGNLCMNGDAHVNGEAIGNNPVQDPHFACDYDYTEGFVILPPPIRTEPDYFPNATYYYVYGCQLGGVYQARIYDRAGNDMTSAYGDSLDDITSYDPGSKTYTFDFGSDAIIDTYFNDATGVFRRRNPTDVAAVVNFGELPISPPGAEVASLIFDGSTTSTIHATVINTRFTGITDEDRIDYRYWTGAVVEVRQIIFEPYYGIAMIAYDLDKNGSSHVWIGTETWPALLYVTRDVDRINANFHLVGSMICLRNFVSEGGPDVIYDEGFLQNLPDWLIDSWPDGTSGLMKILRWREVAAAQN